MEAKSGNRPFGIRFGMKSTFALFVDYMCITVQMAEWYRASASGSVDLGFDSESGQTNDFIVGIHSFPA